MPCPHSSSGRTEGDSRRAFMKAAVAIGGMNALSACASLSGNEIGSETPEFPQGTDLEALPDSQHAWNANLVTDRHDDIVQPQHQMFLFLDYVGDGVPTATERETVETALRTLERAYRWGTGDTPNAIVNDGLLFTIGYAPAYFERFDADLPGPVNLPPPERVLTDLDDDPDKADESDALLHVASDRAQVVLSAEEALFGGLDRLNGIDVEADLTGVFERADRRTGVVGRGLPAEHIDDESIPEQAPASMGFKSAFKDTQPAESSITIDDGPFAGGTTQHVSRLEIDLEMWYGHDHDERVKRMFSPEHSADEVGEIGEGLGGHSGVTEALADETENHARERGLVGHAQKIARARNDDSQPRILRRGDFNAPAEPGSVLHFGSLQKTIDDFVDTRRMMDGLDAEEADERSKELPEEDDGILAFIEATNRANFLVPPRRHRALPSPRPSDES